MVIARSSVPQIACSAFTVFTKAPLEKSGLRIKLLGFIGLSRPEISLRTVQHAGQRNAPLGTTFRDANRERENSREVSPNSTSQ